MTAAPTASRRRPDIQGLRAIAVLAVVAFHAGLPLPGGFVGVDVFFVISGFVITSMLMRERHRTGRISFGRFYWRRFTRLTPALALVVSVTMLASLLVLSPLGPQQMAAQTGLGSLLLVANIVIARNVGYFDPAAEANPLLNTWSLSVEEQFYLVFPALLVLGWILARRRSGILRASPFAIVGLVAAVSLTFTVLGSLGYPLLDTPTLLGFYSPLTRAWEFAAGALLALLAARWRPGISGTATALRGTGLVLIVISLWAVTPQTPWPGPWTLMPVIGTMLVLVPSSAHTTPVSRLLSMPPLVRVGDWSYSIYLWHWPFICFALIIWPDLPAAALLAAIASLVPALVSYRWVEQPLRGRTYRQPASTALLAGVLAPPIVLAMGLGIAAQNALWIPDLREAQLASRSEPHPGWSTCLSSGSMTGQALILPGTVDCRFNPDAPGAPIYLVGDSTAAALSDALIGAGEALGRPVIVHTAAGCPFLDAYRITSEFTDRANERCREYQVTTAEWLDTQPSGVVVISNVVGYWWDATSAIGATQQTATSDIDERRSELQAGLTRTAQKLRSMGQSVLIVEPIPRLPTPRALGLSQRCSVLGLVVTQADDPACSSSLSPAAVDDLVAGPVDTARAAATASGSATVDLRPDLCSDRGCSTFRDGQLMWADHTHISSQASRDLAPVFVAAIADQ